MGEETDEGKEIVREMEREFIGEQMKGWSERERGAYKENWKERDRVTI